MTVWVRRNIWSSVPHGRASWTSRNRQAEQQRQQALSHSLHSWKTLLLNNELNLGSASGGRPRGAALSSTTGFVAHIVRAGRPETCTHKPFCPATGSYMQNAALIGRQSVRGKRGRETEANKAGRHRRDRGGCKQRKVRRQPSAGGGGFKSFLEPSDPFLHLRGRRVGGGPPGEKDSGGGDGRG